jgi:hypothetical protein
MYKIIALLTIFFSPLLVADIEGDYIINGYDAYYEQSYTGIAQIIKIKGNVYNIKWTYDQNKSVYESFGTGILVDDVFSVAFKNLPSEDTPEDGLQVYKLTRETLEGPYVLLGRNLLGFEKLQKQ